MAGLTLTPNALGRICTVALHSDLVRPHTTIFGRVVQSHKDKPSYVRVTTAALLVLADAALDRTTLDKSYKFDET
ncbi:uncharacterized protein L3040_000998 [Drepanopeziza brunnea f. sp. 'multigermtubi']|uniref:uncharacterized protein n=1 Tax=Drepanopeziza brunnea f. sp. 'multigermtubi' TaxID=698441 RepID=UPI002395E581|nr:hypothetical protein L3040_000998 [Drepanopeziza brunnea f. sp. 'multigermtubi']